MKKAILTMCMLSTAVALQAEETVIDNFNRADTSFSSTASEIGKEWKSETPMTWAVQNAMLVADYNVPGEYVLEHTALKTDSGNGKGFEVRGDVAGMFGGAWGGIAFNYQNQNNFYAVRFQTGTGTYQLVKVVNGKIAACVSNKDAVKQFNVGEMYTIRVRSSEGYKFSFEITESGGIAPLNPTTDGVDTSRNFTGGSAGLYVRSAQGSARPDVMFDDFSVTVR